MSAQIESQPRPARRSYSDMERARALALYDMCGSLTETAKKSGIPDSTLSQWITGKRRAQDTETSLLRTKAGLSLADNFEEIAYEVTSVALRKLKSKNAEKIPFGQLMQGSSHAVQNFQLIRGLPTSIVEERIEGRAVLVLMSNALGIAGQEEDPVDSAIDVTPEKAIVEAGSPVETGPEGQE
jgi:transposase-like protein